MTDLERRVRDALRGLPDPPEGAREEVRRAALDALPHRARPSRRRWALAVAGVAAIAVAGAALAATDRLDVRIGPAPAPPQAASPTEPPRGEVALPDEADGLALVAGGRLWLGTRSGLGVQGLAVDTAELSPNARFAAVGIGRSLVAMAPDGRRAWSQPTPGAVAASRGRRIRSSWPTWSIAESATSST